jgi:hypothetical protein
MKKFIIFLIFFIVNCSFAKADMSPIVVQNGGSVNDHLEHFIPFDQPDVYYDNVVQTIVIDGDGAVDNKRTPGDVTIKRDVEYEIEASGMVTLHDGFKVEKGATFAINPSCF